MGGPGAARRAAAAAAAAAALLLAAAAAPPPPPSSSSSPPPPPCLSLAPGTYASCWVPLWAGCGREEGGRRPLWPAAVASLAASGLVGPGGVATSAGPGSASGEQWDGPNAWPPLQALLADGLAGVSGEEGAGTGAAAAEAAALAERLVAGFVTGALAGLAAEGTLREKYCSLLPDGTPGAGGEYATQAGFGWTNGAVLALLRRFGWPPASGRAAAVGENGG